MAVVAALVGANITVNVALGVAGHTPYVREVSTGAWSTGELHWAHSGGAFRALGRPAVGAAATPGATPQQWLRLCAVADCAALVGTLPPRPQWANPDPKVGLGFDDECRAVVMAVDWFDHIAAAAAGELPGADCGSPPPEAEDETDIMVITSFAASLLALGLMVGVVTAGRHCPPEGSQMR